LPVHTSHGVAVSVLQQGTPGESQMGERTQGAWGGRAGRVVGAEPGLLLRWELYLLALPPAALLPFPPGL